MIILNCYNIIILYVGLNIKSFPTFLCFFFRATTLFSMSNKWTILLAPSGASFPMGTFWIPGCKLAREMEQIKNPAEAGFSIKRSLTTSIFYVHLLIDLFQVTSMARIAYFDIKLLLIFNI